MIESLEKFRPSTRILTSIGKDLIKDDIAAIIELIKNSYDAEAENVWIDFYLENNQLVTSITDDGFGMTKDDILNKWLVPATDSKVGVVKSPNKNRPTLGQKGLGRYSAFILGNILKISSVASNELTEFEVNLSEIQEKKYLDQVDIKLKSMETDKNSGTTIIITDNNHLFFNSDKYGELKRQLQLLISPLENVSTIINIKDNFNIYIRNRSENVLFDNGFEKIKAYEILDIYHYRFYGEIIDLSKGLFSLTFENYTLGEKNSYSIKLTPEFYDLMAESNFNENYQFDFKVYDRDSDGVSLLLQKSQYTKSNELKKLLDDISGVKIYRNNFRIGTYGDNEHDWLDLNMDRVQNPSLKISANQILGIIKINAQESSNLIEKSARDGLQENETFKNFKSLTKILINIMQNERYAIRQKLLAVKKAKSIHDTINSVSDYDSVIEKITTNFMKAGMSASEVSLYIKPLEEKKKADELSLKEISKRITIYEKQITIGKLVEILMHEGKKSLNALKDYPENLKGDFEKIKDVIKENSDMIKLIERIHRRLNSIQTQSNILMTLFKKINPLTNTRSSNRRIFNISSIFNEAIEVFENEIIKQSITIENNLEEVNFYGWKEDFVIGFTNLIDNSIYWMKNSEKKIITINSRKENNLTIIEYSNSGQEISIDLIEKEQIFEPGISFKENGTGIGLPIAGESFKRNGFTLKCQYIKNGALFILEGESLGGEN